MRASWEGTEGAGPGLQKKARPNGTGRSWLDDRYRHVSLINVLVGRLDVGWCPRFDLEQEWSLPA